MFTMYLELGFEHISDLVGYDHILFIVALTAVYRMQDWRKVAVLITAFTIGHSITLALATLDILSVPSDLIEFLIPVTVFISGFSNFFHKDKRSNRQMQIFKYFLALIFGLIHGLGFSNYLKALLGGAESLLMPLFAFNVGLEFGQIFIVLIILSVVYLLVNKLKVNHRELILILSGAAVGISLIMLIERFPY